MSLVTHHLVVAAAHGFLVAFSATTNVNGSDRAAVKANSTDDIGSGWHKAKKLTNLVVIGGLHNHENQRKIDRAHYSRW